MRKLIDAWYQTDAPQKIGPLWSFVTDGDATRRKAGHRVFMATKLTPSSPLYSILSDLSALISTLVLTTQHWISITNTTSNVRDARSSLT